MANNCGAIGANSNATSLAVAIACNADAATQWWYMEPNDIGSFAAELERVARNPLSLDRQNLKGAVTNLTASPAFTCDSTVDSLAFWAPVSMFTKWKSVTSGVWGYKPTEVTADGFTVVADGALADGALVIARGFATTANNGLHVVGAGSSATEIKVTGLTAEAGVTKATLHECGFKFAAGDLVVTTANMLTLTAGSFSTLPIMVGQVVYVAGSGYMRVRTIADKTLTVDATTEPLVPDAATNDQIFFGSFCRNVSVTDPDFNMNHMLIEVGYDLPAGRAYEYAEVSVLNTLALALPLTDKSTLDLAFVAKDIPAATETRRDGVFNKFSATELFNTSDDIARLQLRNIDEQGLSTYFTDGTVNVNNNVSPKNVLGVLGAADLNYGNFEVTDSLTTLFTDTKVTQALRDNTTCSLSVALVNNDGAVVVDQPAITLGGGGKSFPQNDKVEIALDNNAFGSDFGYTMSCSLFRYIPPVVV